VTTPKSVKIHGIKYKKGHRLVLDRQKSYSGQTYSFGSEGRFAQKPHTQKKQDPDLNVSQNSNTQTYIARASIYTHKIEIMPAENRSFSRRSIPMVFVWAKRITPTY
jgi:hypothetical protein